MNIFLVSDTHFGHQNILNFKLQNGLPMRPFRDVEEMDEHMIERWNSVVRPQDHVYHLGDVAIRKEGLLLMSRVHGHKRLVRGNHDILDEKLYQQFFEKIYGVRVIAGLLLSHIPVHPNSLRHWINIHGHLHNNEPQGSLGPDYYNVSVEMIDYTPIALEEVRKRVGL